MYDQRNGIRKLGICLPTDSFVTDLFVFMFYIMYEDYHVFAIWNPRIPAQHISTH